MRQVSRQVRQVRVVCSLLRGQVGCGGSIGGRVMQNRMAASRMYTALSLINKSTWRSIRRLMHDDLTAVTLAHLRGVDSQRLS